MRRPRSCRRTVRQLLGPCTGVSLVEILTVALVIGVLAGMAVPSVSAALAHARLVGAARYVSARLLGARHAAAAHGTAVALRFTTREGALRIGTFIDGNHNGIRRADIASGTDQPFEPEVDLGQLFEGVGGGTPDGSAPAAGAEETLFSFAPSGTSSSGTVYVRGRDGNQYAIRVLGATGRIRLQRFRLGTGEWTDLR